MGSTWEPLPLPTMGIGERIIGAGIPIDQQTVVVLYSGIVVIFEKMRYGRFVKMNGFQKGGGLYRKFRNTIIHDQKTWIAIGLYDGVPYHRNQWNERLILKEDLLLITDDHDHVLLSFPFENLSDDRQEMILTRFNGVGEESRSSG